MDDGEGCICEAATHFVEDVSGNCICNAEDHYEASADDCICIAANNFVSDGKKYSQNSHVN